MYIEEAFDKAWDAAWHYFSDDATLVFGDVGGGCIESRLSIERYADKVCRHFKVEICLEYNEMTVAWGFDETTFRVRDTTTIPQELEDFPQVIVRTIDGILRRYGHPDALQPVEEPDITRLMEYIEARWNRQPNSGIMLDESKGLDGLTWLDSDQAEVLSLIPAEVRGKWQINAMAYHIDTFDWSDVDMSRSVYEMAQAVADRPRVPTVTTFAFRDQGAADSDAHVYWLREVREELWDTVEANLEMYLDRSL